VNLKHYTMKYKAIFISLFILIISCKDEKKAKDIEGSTTLVKVDNTDDYFSLSIEATIEQDDDFVLYYLEGDEVNISNENSVPLKVTGSMFPQNLIFNLQEDILPTKLIIKYGNEQKNQKMQFYGGEINYLGEKIVMDSYKFYQFFIPNLYIDYNQKNHIAISKEKNGKYEPIFFSRKVLEDKIDYTFY